MILCDKSTNRLYDGKPVTRIINKGEHPFAENNQYGGWVERPTQIAPTAWIHPNIILLGETYVGPNVHLWTSSDEPIYIEDIKLKKSMGVHSSMSKTATLNKELPPFKTFDDLLEPEPEFKKPIIIEEETTSPEQKLLTEHDLKRMAYEKLSPVEKVEQIKFFPPGKNKSDYPKKRSLLNRLKKGLLK